MGIKEWSKDRSGILEPTEQRCLHEGCDMCGGTGRKKDGSICVHMISCPCPRC